MCVKSLPYDAIKNLLESRKIDTLYHVNTVTTSVSFLKEKALCSRSYIDNHHLAQTPQSSDEKDKSNKVWDCIFLNFVDIHAQCKQICYYGPVSFEVNVEILKQASQIFITRTNPAEWNEHWDLIDLDDINSVFRTNFGHIIMIKTSDGKLDFDKDLKRIVVDDPCIGSYYKNAIKRLSQISPVVIQKRKYDTACKCLNTYNAATSRSLLHWFI